jgi:hypothetical protein
MDANFVRRVYVCATAALIVSTSGPISLSAAPDSGPDQEEGYSLHVTKDCSQYTGAAGSFCTITSSNLPEIVAGAHVFYDQADGVPAGLLDSNVVLDAGGGNRAMGRCTLDDNTGFGLCTFSDGVGSFAGFHARVKVSPPTDGVNWHWDGTYSFDRELE